MPVRQLEEFLGQADQKGFWIFTYANLAGGFIGAFAGNGLAERVAPSAAAFKLLGIALGVLFGVTTTWKVKGHAVYTWALLLASFALRRYARIGMTDAHISAGEFYRPGASRQKPFMLVATRDGRSVPVLLHRGSGTGYDSELEQLEQLEQLEHLEHLEHLENLDQLEQMGPMPGGPAAKSEMEPGHMPPGRRRRQHAAERARGAQRTPKSPGRPSISKGEPGSYTSVNSSPRSAPEREQPGTPDR